MSPCPVCSQPVDPLRSRAVAVRDGKVIAYCSKECLAGAQKDGGEPSPPARVTTPSVIEIASTAPAKRDDTIGTWAIGDDTAIRKYGERSTAEHEALSPDRKSRAGIVILLLLLLGAGGFGVYHYVHDATATNR
jgi:YHS domain-containing protein